jgi:hypothetical protein
MTTTEATAEMSIEQRWMYYTEIEGWTYIPDPKTWSGGVWWHDERGSVNRQGGTFPNITRAVEAMDRHYRNQEMWR